MWLGTRKEPTVADPLYEPSQLVVESPHAYPEPSPSQADLESTRKASQARPRRMAVLTVHGMGQQVEFETLDGVAQGLREEARRRGQEPKPPSLRQVEIEGEIFRRVEMELLDPVGDVSEEVHVYEAYWAPRTEGRVTLRDVVSFLKDAGFNGIAHSFGPFRRWVFNKRVDFPRSVLSLVALAGVLAVVLSLSAVSAILTAVGAARASFSGPPKWLTKELFSDLTAVAGIFCLGAVCFGVLLGLAMFRRKAAPLGKPWSLPAPSRATIWLFFLLTCAMAIMASLAMVWLVRHQLGHPNVSVILGRIGSEGDLSALVTAGCGLALLAALLGALVQRHGTVRPARWRGFLLSGLFYLTMAGLVLSLSAVAALFAGRPVALAGLLPPLDWVAARWEFWVWALLLMVSAKVRTFLIQFLGDVAVYVSPFKLDRFDALRSEIKTLVCKTATAVYRAKEADGSWTYDRIALVGHSLGSVIVYDTLNHLINQDLLHQGELDAVDRTKLLLTFGSPLDKIAFLFASQGSRASEVQEGLRAVVQPLIQSYANRTFDWINVYSRNDIISGSLEFFDDDSSNPQRVKNVIDPESSIPLVAHTEYWKNRLIWRYLYNSICHLPWNEEGTVKEPSRERRPTSRPSAASQPSSPRFLSRLLRPIELIGLARRRLTRAKVDERPQS